MKGKPYLRTTMLIEHRCPYCAHVVTHASSFHGGRPLAGDVTLCIECLQVCVFDDKLRMRKPTAEELAEFAASSDLTRRIEAMRGQFLWIRMAAARREQKQWN